MKVQRVTSPFQTEEETAKTVKNPAMQASYFKSGTKAITPGKNLSFRGRILPSFDLSLDTSDQSFKTSWAPYRMDEGTDAAGNLLFSEFAVAVWVYNFLGNQKGRLVSPSSKKYLGYNDLTAESIADPIADIIATIKNSDNDSWSNIMRRGQDGFAKLSTASPRAFFNMYGYKNNDKSTIGTYVVDVSSSAYKNLAAALNSPSVNGKGRDADWPQYLLGDITHPDTGLIANIEPIYFVTEDGERKYYNGFNLYPKRPKDLKTGFDNLEGIQEKAVTDNILADRHLIQSEDGVLKIYSYSEIVEYLSDDGAFPNELLKTACGHMVDSSVFSKDRAESTHVVLTSSSREIATPGEHSPSSLASTGISKSDLEGAAYIPPEECAEKPSEDPDPTLEMSGGASDDKSASSPTEISEEDKQWFYDNALPDKVAKMDTTTLQRWTELGIALNNDTQHDSG